MGKKSKKKKKSGLSFAERLAKQIQLEDPANLADQAAGVSMKPDEFRKAFAQALELHKQGPDPRDLISLPTVYQLAFLHLAQADKDDDLIGDLMSMSDAKEVIKLGRRVLHQLRSQGVDVEIPDDKGPSVLDRMVDVEEKPLPCYLSPVSADGSRMVVMAKYTHGGVSVHQGEFNDEDGLVQFGGGTIGRNRYRQLNQQMDNPDEDLLQIDYTEARSWLAKAVERNRLANKPLPDEYLEASSELGESSKEPLVDPSQEFPQDKSTDPDLATQAKSLLDLAEFAQWLPDLDTVTALDEKLKEVESSQLVINEQQRIDQVQRVIDSGSEMVLEDENKRALFHTRLLENAHYLKRINLDQEAKICAAVAWQLVAEGFEPKDSVFFSEMIKKVYADATIIAAAMRPIGETVGEQEIEEEEQDSASKLIVTP